MEKTLVGLLLLSASLVRLADGQVNVYTSRSAFLAATTGLTNVDLAHFLVGLSRKDYGQFTSGAITIGGFGTSLAVESLNYCCDAYNRGGLPSVTGLDKNLPLFFVPPTFAIGFEAFTTSVREVPILPGVPIFVGNLLGTNQDVIDVHVNGYKYSFKSAPAPKTVFIGFTSAERVDQISIATSQAGGYRQVNIQNVSYGSAIPIFPASAPFGSVDTPPNNSTNLSGAVNVTGWALSSNTISGVDIYREQTVVGEIAPLVYLAPASIIPAVRPDVSATYPGYPNNTYGWGLQVLTNQLPGTSGHPLGNGTYKLHAIASNPLGETTDLAAPITIAVNNAAAIQPFGTIDTPAPGETISGAEYVNFGWAVTPRASDVIPKDGSTITVYIDNIPVAHPVYNNLRSDIASLFPGLQNSNGAIGYYKIDSTKLANGIHSISWVAVDSAGHATGLGSRYFFVSN